MIMGVANMSRAILKSVSAVAFVLCAATVSAQLPNPYGAPVSGENAKKAAAAAIAEARKNNWTMAAAVVDPAGDLVYFEKVDGTQAASVDIAIDKARSAARFKRPTKALQDVLAAGGVGLRMLALQGAAFSKFFLANSFNILLKYGLDRPFVIESIFLSNSAYLLSDAITTSFDICESCRAISFL